MSSASEEEEEGLTILILGGFNSDFTRNLINYLYLNNNNNEKQQKIKIIDKYLILIEEREGNNEQEGLELEEEQEQEGFKSTCYIDNKTRGNLISLIKAGLITYEQSNLFLKSNQIKAFTLPSNSNSNSNSTKGYSIVYDFTSGTLLESLNLPLSIQIERTLKLSLELGQLAASTNVGVYTKLLLPFYKLSSSSSEKGKVGDETNENELKVECWGQSTKLINESIRGLAKIKGLNLVCLRPGIVYGEGTLEGITPRFLIAEIYKQNSETLDFLWSESLPQSTIHISDLCSALYLTSIWSLHHGRSRSLELAGEVLPYSLASSNGEKDKKEQEEDRKILEGLKKAGFEMGKEEEEEVKVVLFNVVDEGNTTLGDIASVITSVVGIKVGFQNKLISALAALNMKDAVEDINDKHLESYLNLQVSDPSLSPTSPLSPIIPSELLQPYPISLSSSKLIRLLGPASEFAKSQTHTQGGWKAEKKLDKGGMEKMIESFRKEGNLPSGVVVEKEKKVEKKIEKGGIGSFLKGVGGKK